MKTNRFSESFANADAVFNGMYSAELRQLKDYQRRKLMQSYLHQTVCKPIKH